MIYLENHDIFLLRYYEKYYIYNHGSSGMEALNEGS